MGRAAVPAPAPSAFKNAVERTAVRVEHQGRHLVAYLPKAAMAAVLEDLRANGQAALSFARPTDDRAVQVKGEFISARDAGPDEEEFVLGQWQALSDDIRLVPIGRGRFMLQLACSIELVEKS